MTVPVMYAEDGAEQIVFARHPERKSWWRNLRDGAAVEVRLRGRRLLGQAAVSTDTAAASSYLERYPRARAAVAAEPEPTFVRISALEPAG